MRALVTGGAGFIGSALCRRLIALPEAHVLVLDKLTYAGDVRTLEGAQTTPRLDIVEGDIADTPLVLRLLDEFRPDRVFHLAAESHVDRSITGPADFIHTNIVGTFSMLSAVQAHVQANPAERERLRMVHVSTDEVYGSLGAEGLFAEDTPYDPRSPYAASKASADHLARAWAHTYGAPVIVSNCSNNYGPYQFPEKLIPNIILKALAGEKLPVYGDGLNVRDWLHVEDHVDALLRIADRGEIGRRYLVGGRSERTNLDVVQSICDVVDELSPRAEGSRRALITFVADRPGHDRRYAVDCSRVEAELGWRPQRGFEAGLRETVAWYLANRDWWAPILDGRYRGERLGLLDAR